MIFLKHMPCGSEYMRNCPNDREALISRRQVLISIGGVFCSIHAPVHRRLSLNQEQSMLKVSRDDFTGVAADHRPQVMRLP